MTRLSTNDPDTAPTPSQWPHRSVRRPPSSSTAAPSAGSAITTLSREKTPSAEAGSTAGGVTWLTECSRTVAGAMAIVVVPSVLQQTGVVDRGRASGAEDGHDDRQADHHLGSRDHHHEEGRDLTVEVAVGAGEGDQREVARVEHQLDAH